MREQENPAAASSLESGNNRLPGARWSVLEADHAGWRVHELELAAERSQAPGNQIGNAVQPLDVGAPRLDGDQITERIEECLPLALRTSQQRVR